MRRPQAFGRPRSYHPLNRGVSDFLKQKTAAFGGNRAPPSLDWGPAWHFSSKAYPQAFGGKFNDGRMVVATLIQKQADTTLSVTDSYVISADGLTPTPIVSPFPNAGSNGSGVSTLLGDGRLLFLGGGVGNKAQTIDPGTLTWVAQPDLPANLDSNWGLVTLPNGNALRMGGIGFSVDDTSQEFDYNTNLWISRGNLNFARYGFASTVLSNGKVLVCGPQGTGPEIYDPATHLWTPSAGTLSINNSGLAAFTTSGGRTFLASVGSGFTIFLDEYFPASDTFVARASMPGSFLTQTIFAGAYQFFDIGDNYLALVELDNFPSRTAYYDILNDSWLEIPETYPEAMAKGAGSVLQVTKDIFIAVGGGENPFFYQYTIPHDASRYALMSTLRAQTPIRPTFAGLSSVEQGTDPTKVVLHWSPASHPVTYVGDIAYFVAVGFNPGDAVANADAHIWYATSQAWAGLNSIEIYNLPADTDCYFVVRARKMTFTETNTSENQSFDTDFDTNSVEVLFHTAAALSAPTFAWGAAPSMSEPRTGLSALKLATNQPFSQGDVRRIVTAFGLTTGGSVAVQGDMYDPMGTSILEQIIGIPDTVFEHAAFDADPFLDDGNECRKLTLIGGDATGVTRQDNYRYYQYSRSWSPNDGIHPLFPQMNEAVSRHTATGLAAPNVHDVLRAGGTTLSGDDTSATNTAERLFHRFLQRVFYTAGTTPFTVGAVLTGGTSGTQGNIIAIQPSGPSDGVLYVDTVPYGGGFYFATESITDSLGGAAITLFFSGSAIYENWQFVASMLYKRQYHSALFAHVNGVDGVLVAGGVDDQGNKIRTMEFYRPDLDQWERIPGLILPYTAATTFNQMTAGTYVASGTSNSWALLEDDNPHPILNTTGVLTFGYESGSVFSFFGGEHVSNTNIQWNNISGGSFTPGETVSGNVSGASGVVWAVPLDDGFQGVIVVGNPTGPFSPSDVITGGTSGATADVTGLVGSDKQVTLSSAVQEAIRPHVKFAMVALPPSFGGYFKVLLIGGEGNFGGNSAVDIFDPNGPDIWSGGQVSHAADLPNSRDSHTAHLFQDGTGSGWVGVFGGIVSGVASKDVRLYDINLDSWSHPADMGTERAGHASTLLPNNKVLVVGGTDSVGTILASAEKSG